MSFLQSGADALVLYDRVSPELCVNGEQDISTVLGGDVTIMGVGAMIS
jgi:hypothetical protein